MCLRLQHFHGFRGDGRLVLDVLRFIDNREPESQIFVFRKIALQIIVGGDQHVEGGRRRDDGPALGGRPDDGRGGKLRREAGELVLPVVDQRGRADDNGRTCLRSLQLRREEHGDRLKRLAKAHVVGEDPAEAIGVQRPKPAIAGDLVFAERTLQEIRNREIRVGNRLELLDERFKMPVPVGIGILHGFQHPVEVKGAEGRYLKLLLDERLWREVQRVQKLVHLRDGFVVLQLDEIPAL